MRTLFSCLSSPANLCEKQILAYDIKSVLQYQMYHLISLSYFQYPSNWYSTTHKICSNLPSCSQKDVRSTYYIHAVSIFVTQLHNRDATRQNMIFTMLLNVKDVFVKHTGGCLLCQWSPKWSFITLTLLINWHSVIWILHLYTCTAFALH